MAADVAAKLLPVSDNLKRALEAESSVEAAESDEFRHFLSGVDLIWKQLNGVLEALGGPMAPQAWRGALPTPYHLGPGPAEDLHQSVVLAPRFSDSLIR